MLLVLTLCATFTIMVRVKFEKIDELCCCVDVSNFLSRCCPRSLVVTGYRLPALINGAHLPNDLCEIPVLSGKLLSDDNPTFSVHGTYKFNACVEILPFVSMAGQFFL